MKLKKLIKQFIPPVFLIIFRKLKKNEPITHSLWIGNYKNWEQALTKSSGYHQDNILDKVKTSLLKVKNGQAAYERDSVVFHHKQYSWALISNLLWVASKYGNKLNLIDFGGSLGSTYYQNKDYLNHLNEFSWNIVEQSHFVKEGKKTFEDQTLKFVNKIEDCLHLPNQCLLISNSLQYLPAPYEFIETVLELDLPYIIINSTAFMKKTEQLVVQHVPKQIYEATYPAWFLSEEKFLSKMIKKYELISNFKSDHTPPVVVNGVQAYWKGFLFRLK